jgi:hypothetical protein
MALKIANPDTVIAADTNVNEYQFDSGLTADMLASGTQWLKIKITVGSWKFGVGKAPSSNSATYQVGDTIDLPINNGVCNLNAKATSVSDAFTVSAI